jgi:probable dihydroxyacetone kinase regulator
MGNYNQYVKSQFEQALRKLMKSSPLEKITIKMLAEECGTTRQDFYYHFRDIYDLVNWIYSAEIDKAFNSYPDEPFLTRLIRLYESLDEQRSFYKKVFSLNGQNTLVEYIVEHDLALQKKLILDYNPSAVIDTETEFAIDFYSCAAIYMTRYWFNSPNRISPAEFSYRLYQCMPLHLRNILP